MQNVCENTHFPCRLLKKRNEHIRCQDYWSVDGYNLMSLERISEETRC